MLPGERLLQTSFWPLDSRDNRERRIGRGGCSRAKTARGALELLLAAGGEAVVARVGNEMLRTLRTFTDRPVSLEALTFSAEGHLLWQGKSD